MIRYLPTIARSHYYTQRILPPSLVPVHITNKPLKLPRSRFGSTVRLILTEDDPNDKGYKGDVITVRAGYARNFLIPKKKAVYATPQNFKKLGITEEVEVVQKEEASDDKKAADLLKKYFSNKEVIMHRNAESNESGTPLHPGLVRSAHVREKLSKQLKIDLEDHEKLILSPQVVEHHELSNEQEIDAFIEKIPNDEEAVIRRVGVFYAKIVLRGDFMVPLKVRVVKR
mmetsp:Transcript_30125/g.36817  ORF Transcript_30125/g.36817 Transcript_30125/m.36817 type:complete len:228 (+) Transcript_30125:100-783(+)|eukprot:CAMPEP_0172497818 /NCGR_PEP_ID=MMETSP1066-20121228/105621_1 /TAXON_ID=671091 /ORGANISM="Coscinodiscus wailesii, Strain CCMP2513" /LENGTH=227 /DNA_ID=CAMNT_0013270795 /DNA_START=91 /DNA_END=774 /DNA_ORIENTATION=-